MRSAIHYDRHVKQLGVNMGVPNSSICCQLDLQTCRNTEVGTLVYDIQTRIHKGTTLIIRAVVCIEDCDCGDSTVYRFCCQKCRAEREYDNVLNAGC